MFGSPLAVAFAYRGIGPPPVRGVCCWGGGSLPLRGIWPHPLADCGADGDVAEAEAAIERLAAAPSDDGLAVRDILFGATTRSTGAGSR